MVYGQPMAEATSVLQHVRSADGTRIGYRRSGEGPPLVLVHGTTGAHWSFRFLAPALVDRFTLYTIDRRGRGESGDRSDYAIEHEFENVAAVVDSIDEPATLLGHSYGATVALGTALVAGNLHKLVLYEAAPGMSVVPRGDLERIEDLVTRDDREEALVYALRCSD
jgi:pimeloyl-ACP methyl ester carboxylesterase